MTERSPLPLVASRPLKVDEPRNGPRPRMEISEAPPFSRWVEAPVMVSMASPMDSAGRSPMSSAASTSATTVSSRFLSIEVWMVPRMPVTWTWSRVVACAGGASASCAWASGSAAAVHRA
ncbi:hypothetical protein D3C71_1179440 [compost metagenome]